MIKADPDIPFGDAEFRELAALAHREFGLALSESKKPLVYSRLSKRLRARGIARFSDYLSLLDRETEADERMELVSALTTNVTRFFRENHHFETLAQLCLPAFRAKLAAGRRVRIWSAGCSSGQEPYSIAITVLEHAADLTAGDLRILATDIDHKMVQHASEGRFMPAELEGLPEKVQDAYFHPAGDCAEIAPQPRSLVRFGQLNLMEAWPFRGQFDAIFCRNVAIYFDRETQQRLWSRFCDRLEPGGHLFIGHSERVSGPAEAHLSPCGITTYRKHGH